MNVGRRRQERLYRRGNTPPSALCDEQSDGGTDGYHEEFDRPTLARSAIIGVPQPFPFVVRPEFAALRSVPRIVPGVKVGMPCHA